ncbi:CotO family spore coat protein [Terribacillus saccharophilus]|uniref:CotO family spore coat protein n=1 Tax=Terribacillus saccharophilus TaxID=361277 RepID=UPI003981D0E4
MSKEKVRHQQPLLFIAQPKLDLPNAEMQQAYRTAKGKKKEVKTEEEKPEAAAPKEEQAQSTEKKVAPTNKKVNFKDLPTAGKVEYFLNLPAQIPRMKCELVTAEGSLIGTISGKEGDLIQFKSIRRPFRRELKLEDIRDIKLLGF